MGKLFFWALVIVIAMIALRLWNIAQNKQRRHDASPEAPGPGPRSSKPSDSDAAMVRCVRCGVFLPRTEARMTHEGYRCNDDACNRHA